MRTVVDPGFQSLLVTRVANDGRSQARIAAAANISEPTLSQLMHGHRNPSVSVARNLDEALGCNGELVALVLPLLTDEEADRLTTAISSSANVTDTTMDAFAAALAAQRILDDTMGSAALLRPVATQVDQISRMLTNARGPGLPRLVDVAAQYAQFIGWLCTNTSKWVDAERWFATALQWATESGNANLVATVLSYQGHVAWLRFQPQRTLNLSLAALRDPTIYPGQVAYDCYQAARAYAVLGDLVATDRMIVRGDDMAGRSDAFTGDKPSWQYYRSSWLWQVERGLVHRYAARHDKARISRAVEDLKAGTEAVPESMRAADWYAEYLDHLGAAYLDAGEFNEAGAALTRARGIAAAVNSRRVVQRVEQRMRRLLV